MLQQQETRVFNGENVLNFFSEDSHNTQRTHFWCVSGWIYAIQLSDKDCGVLYLGCVIKISEDSLDFIPSPSPSHTVILEYFNIKEEALFSFAFQSF